MALSDGTVNSVWLVETGEGEPVVVRVGPSREEADRGPSWMRSDALACEAIVLDLVREAVPGVPVPVAAGFRDRERAWLAQTVVPGHPLRAVLPRMAMVQRRAVWQEVGKLARRLHTVAGPWFGTPDGRKRYPDWATMVRADAEGLLGDAQRYGLDRRPFETLLADIDQHDSAVREVLVPTVVHSDLDARHVFVREGDNGWHITGVIDWEYARYADPHSESLLVAMMARPDDDPDRVAFLAGYGLGADALTDPGFQARQSIYRGIVDGWALTDAARLKARAEIVNAG